MIVARTIGKFKSRDKAKPDGATLKGVHILDVLLYVLWLPLRV